MAGKLGSQLHNFTDTETGNPISLSLIASALGETTSAARRRLEKHQRETGKLPADFHAFLASCFGVEDVKRSIDREKLRSLRFKNEVEEKKYVEAVKISREVAGKMASLREEMYALPERVASELLACSDRRSVIDTLLTALEAHMREVGSWRLSIDESQ